MATIEKLLTAEEFLQLPAGGPPSELVRGVIVMMNLPNYGHGAITSNIDILLGSFVKQHGLGRTVVTDSGVVTKRDPDSVRGPDVAYYSYERIPKGTWVRGYPEVTPDLVFEVLSPSDRWSEVLSKVAEFLQAGVRAACVLDPDNNSVQVYRPEQPPQQFASSDGFSLPDIVPGWRVQVAEFFEL